MRVSVVVTISVVVLRPLVTKTLPEMSTAATIMAEATTRELREGGRILPARAGTQIYL
jgi:hypothetical protein